MSQGLIQLLSLTMSNYRLYVQLEILEMFDWKMLLKRFTLFRVTFNPIREIIYFWI